MKLDSRLQFVKEPIVIICLAIIFVATAIHLRIEHPEIINKYMEFVK